MLKVLTRASLCVLLLGGCTVVDNLAEEKYRLDYLRFTAQEYRDSPGVLFRASLRAWGDYSEEAKVAALIDYYTDPVTRLKSENWRYRFDMQLSRLEASGAQPPVPQTLDREGALRRVHCINELFRELSRPQYQEFLENWQALIQVEAECNAFLSSQSVPTECVGWDVGPRETRSVLGGTMTTREVTVVNGCARETPLN